jgi:uncharacterized GH25 family protein
MKKIFVVMLIGLILASQIIAHDLYLKTENYFAAPNGTVKFEVLNGELNQSVAPFTVARSSAARISKKARSNIFCAASVWSKKRKTFQIS